MHKKQLFIYISTQNKNKKIPDMYHLGLVANLYGWLFDLCYSMIYIVPIAGLFVPVPTLVCPIIGLFPSYYD